MSDKPMFKVGDVLEASNRYGVWRLVQVADVFTDRQKMRIVDVDDPTYSGIVPMESQYIRTHPHATYDGGEPQYRADLATLDAAAELSKTATCGEWAYRVDYKDSVKDKRATNIESNGYHIVLWGDTYHNDAQLLWNNPADAELIINAARVASAWARMSAYLRGKGGL